MTAGTGPIPPADLRGGEQIQAWVGPMVRYMGVVELASPRLGVVWIRDAVLGERIMLDLCEYRLYLSHPGPARSHQGRGK